MLACKISFLINLTFIRYLNTTEARTTNAVNLNNTNLKITDLHLRVVYVLKTRWQLFAVHLFVDIWHQKTRRLSLREERVKLSFLWPTSQILSAVVHIFYIVLYTNQLITVISLYSNIRTRQTLHRFLFFTNIFGMWQQIYLL